jgi:anti-sigma factor RsiW
VSGEPYVSELDLQAYVDGRLPESRRAAVEAWLAAHPEDAERIASYRRLGQEVRAAYETMLSDPVPERLERAASRRPRLRQLAAVLAWVALGAVLGAVAGWNLRPERAVAQLGPDPTVIARRAAIAHATYSPEVRHPVEVGADQEAHLIAWLSKRLGAPLRAPQLDEVGYSLVGGRLLPGDTGPVAHFMYQTQKGARITLYVRTEVAGNRETAFRYAEEGKVRVFYWVDRKMGYAVSSGDISKEELLKVANSVYQQLNP